MKRTFILLIVSLCLTVTTLANVIRVNSNLTTDPAQKIYKTIQEAHDAALAGDTLMIEGSPAVYTGVTLDEKASLIRTWLFFGRKPANPINSKFCSCPNY